MTFVDTDMYIKRATRAGRRNPAGKGTERDWYLIKANGSYARVPIGDICFPLKYLGKRCKIKIEIID